jgi:hypothetical protein
LGGPYFRRGLFCVVAMIAHGIPLT